MSHNKIHDVWTARDAATHFRSVWCYYAKMADIAWELVGCDRPNHLFHLYSKMEIRSMREFVVAALSLRLVEQGLDADQAVVQAHKECGDSLDGARERLTGIRVVDRQGKLNMRKAIRQDDVLKSMRL